MQSAEVPGSVTGADGRRTAFVVVAALFLAGCMTTGAVLSTRATPNAVMVAFALLFALGLLVWVAALQAPLRRPMLLLLGLAVLARLALLPYPPSDDLDRYLWEGRLVLAGESPYAGVAADAPVDLQDEVWAGMNNKDRQTAYPPLAQLVFAAAVAIAYHPLPMKLLFLLADLGILLLIARELQRRALPDAHIALIGCSPVMLLATAGEAHFDALFVLPTLLAIDARARGRDRWAWFALGCAVQIKLVAVLLAPLLLRRGGWRGAWAALPALVLPALPFLADLPALAEGIVAFGGTTAHNGFVHRILQVATGDLTAASAVCWAALALWVGIVARVTSDPWRGGFLVFGGLLLLSPVVHFWYFAWVLPFLALAPQPAWLLLTGLQAVYFTTWANVALGRPWSQPEWAWWAQWLPFGVVLVVTGWHAAARLLSGRRFERSWPAPETVSIVVPTFREAERIAACVEALRRQGPEVIEVIVADGGSPDDTRERAAAAGARVLSAPTGRGRQVAAGCALATGDVVWVMHADGTPAPGTAAAMLHALAAEPAAAGGAAGQRFSRTTPTLLLVECLNAVRSGLFGLSFGDQGQFVRRAALAEIGGFPALPLMEDVELSLRLRRLGPILHLGRNAVASSRRWQRAKAGRAWMVIRFTGSYLLSPRRRALSEDLYRSYYR